MIPILFAISRYTISICLIGSFLWGFVFDWEFGTIWKIGLSVGALLGVLLSVYAQAVMAGGNISQREAISGSGMFLGLIAWLIIGLGVLAIIVKFIFF